MAWSFVGDSPSAVEETTAMHEPLSVRTSWISMPRPANQSRPRPEGRGALLSRREDLRIGQPAVVVDGRVDEAIANALPPCPLLFFLPWARPAPPAPAIWDPAQLLDVDVDQFTGRARSYGVPGRSGGPSTRREPEPDQDPMPVEGATPGDSRAGWPELVPASSAIWARGPTRRGAARWRSTKPEPFHEAFHHCSRRSRTPISRHGQGLPLNHQVRQRVDSSCTSLLCHSSTPPAPPSHNTGHLVETGHHRPASPCPRTPGLDRIRRSSRPGLGTD